MTSHGKRYENTLTLFDQTKAYPPEEAVKLVKETAKAKFDETIELHLRMELDPRNATQQVRGVALLPHGLGKKVRVLVFAQGEAARIAESAGADYVGADDITKKIEEGWLDIDVTIATPDMMSKVSRLGKILGRRGLMPNPKAGTVVSANDLPRVIQEARKGRVEFKLDRQAIIHVPIGKASFEPQQLLENMAGVMDAVMKAKPAGAKGQYIKSITLSSTMGPGIKADLKSAMSMTGV